MRMLSKSTKEISTALAKAQAEIENATKNATNPHFKQQYADLSAVLEVCRPVLSKHGLSVTQTARCDYANGQISLVTTLHHESGEYIRGEMPLILVKKDMQGMGSAITYARRYSLAAMCGIAQEDDDGNGAGSSNAHQQKKQPEKKQIDKQQIKNFLDALNNATTNEEWQKTFKDAVQYSKATNDTDFQTILSEIKIKKIAEVEKQKAEYLEKKTKELEKQPDADPEFFGESDKK